MNDGRTLGVFCGLVLLALSSYGLCVCLGPLLTGREPWLNRTLRWLLVIGAIKFALLPLVRGEPYDVMCWNLWATSIAKNGPAQIYSPSLFEPRFRCNYPPLYLYVLWPLGALANALGLKSYDTVRLFTESPPLVADFLLGLVVFVALRRLDAPALASQGTIRYALNAALLFDSLFWSQNDSVFALAILVSVLLVADSRYALASAIAALAALIKPQGFFILPLLGWWTLFEGRPRDWCRSVLAFVATVAVAFAPFQIGHPWNWISDVYSLSIGLFRVTSDNAFNLLGLLGGLRQPDSKPILGVPAFWFGMGMLASVYVLAGWILWRMRDLRTLILAALLVYLGMFELAPRMHERYLYPALVLVVPLMFDSPAAYTIYRVLTVTLLINLAYVESALIGVVRLRPHDPLAGAIAIANLAALVTVAAYAMFVASPYFADKRFPRALRPLFCRTRSSAID